MNYQSCEVLTSSCGIWVDQRRERVQTPSPSPNLQVSGWMEDRENHFLLSQSVFVAFPSLFLFFFFSLLFFFNHLLPLFPLFLPSHMFYWLHVNILKGLQELVCMAPTNPRPRAWFRDFLTKNLSLLPYLPKCEALTMTTSLWKAQLSNVVYKSALKFVARVA